MKRPINFRLSQKAVAALISIEEALHISKTAAIEEAILLLAKKTLSNRSSLLEFAGILNDKEANNLLKSVKSSKYNKDIDVNL